MTMTIEESIQKAIESLGINGLDSDISVSNSNGTKKPKNTERLENPTDTKPTHEVMNPPDIITSEEYTPVVFCKIKGDTMALLFQKGEFEFGETTMGDITLSTLTCKLPDLSTSKLQELEVIIEKESDKHHKNGTPTKVTSKDTKQEKKVERAADHDMVDFDSNSTELDKLLKEKSQVDSDIKAARASGDTEEVERLRKVRRNIRKQINSL